MSTPLPLPQPSRPSQMRCADSDRDLVAEVLNAAFTEGRITQDEHSERMDALWQAKTFGELTPLTEDLMPHGPIHHLPAPVNGQGAGLVVDPSNANQNPDSIHVRHGRREAPGPLAPAPADHRPGADG